MGSLADFERFILLADAPVRIDIPSEQVRFKGMTDLRYKEPAPAPRLTVHALNTAPVGSQVVALPEQVYHKAYSGHWHRGTDGLAVKVETILAAHPDATLTHPEATP